MKLLIPFLSLIACSCTYYNDASSANVYVKYPEQKNYASTGAALAQSNSESAANFIKTIRFHDYQKWEKDIHKIRDTYARVIKIIDDEKTIQFSVAFFKALSLSEDLDQQTFALSAESNELPNIDSLKFFYTSEKKLDEMIAIISKFANSPNIEVRHCAAVAEKYFQYQKDLITTVLDVDYRRLKTSDIPLGIPPEVLRMNAKLLEQRDQMTHCLISFYASLADKKLSD